MSVYSTHIAGVKFAEGAADILAEMDLSAELELRPEPENKFDPNAVAIYFEDNKLGFIPGYLAPTVRGLIATDSIDMVLKVKGQKVEIHYSGGEENE